ncbi:MAG: HAD hydrolase-like protein [Oligoflexia bacterium]|nr:HAD hydrolase-like protein [Oligoflexia bacterium]
MDNTIYLEENFKVSGFKVVSQFLEEKKILNFIQSYQSLLDILKSKGSLYKKTFDDFCNMHQLSTSLIPEMIEILRNHRPDISPYLDFVEFVEQHYQKYFLGIITDGTGPVQQNKIKSLALHRWFDHKNIIVTDCLSPPSNKHNRSVFIIARNTFEIKEAECTYIGDNPNLDFKHPHQLGWKTIRILRGEHSIIQAEKYVDFEINCYSELNNLIRL